MQIPKNLSKHDVMRALIRQSFYRFCKIFWTTVIAEPMVDNWHIKYLCDELQAIAERVFLQDRGNVDETGAPVLERLKKLYDYIIINVPPGSSKSTIVSEMWPMWCWTVDATIRFICGSSASTVAEDIAGKCYQIYTSELYRALYPWLVENTSGGKTNFKNGLLGERYTTSTGSAITGIHAHIKIVDDPMTVDMATSDVERPKANEWVTQTLGRRNVDEDITVTVVVMQRLHESDTTGYLLEKKGLRILHICIPAELSEDVKPAHLRQYYIDGLFDPKRKNRAVLEKNFQEMGAYGYAGQLMQRPTPSGGAIWKRWFKEIPDEIFPRLEDCILVGSDWDLAYTDDEDNAASAYVVAGVYKSKIYIFDFDWRWLEMPELIKWMKATQGPWYIEAKANGKSAKQILTKMGLSAIEIPVKGGNDKVARARSSTPVAEAGNVCIKKSMADRLYSDSKQGILYFPKGQYKDLADALAQAIQRLSVQGVRVLGADDTDDENRHPVDEYEDRDILEDLYN